MMNWTANLWLEKLFGLTANVNRVELEGYLGARLHGRVTIDGVTSSNMITKAGVKAIVSALCNYSRSSFRQLVPAFQIEKFGASTLTTPPKANDTTLGGSTSFRVCEQVDSVGTKMVVSNFIGQPEFNFNWGKVGLFLNGGQLFSVATVNESKTADVAKTVVWEIEFVED
jgi:hypothetical protein